MKEGLIRYEGGKSYQHFYKDRGYVIKDFWITLPMGEILKLVTNTHMRLEENTAIELQKTINGNNLNSIKNKLKGKRIFLIGNGSSLKDFDFSILDNDETMVMNFGAEFYPKAKHLLFLDLNFVKKGLKIINKFQGNIFAAYRSEAHIRTKKKKTYFFTIDPKSNPTNSFSQGLFGGNSGMAALNLALIMGCDPIYLLGYDLINEVDNIHFYSDEKYGRGGYSTKKCNSKAVDFEKFVDYFPNVKIINLNEKSNIKCFPFDSIENVFHNSNLELLK